MSDEILKRDQNHVTVLAGVSDDADQDITMLRIDPLTKRLLVKLEGGGGTGEPAGSNTQVQYNDDGEFGADEDFTFDDGLLSVENVAATQVRQEVEFHSNSPTADTVLSETSKIDLNVNNHFELTLQSSTTLAFQTDPDGPTKFKIVTIQDSTGGWEIIWPQEVKFTGGTAPTVTTTAESVNIWNFYYDGTDYYVTSYVDDVKEIPASTAIDFSTYGTVWADFDAERGVSMDGANRVSQWDDQSGNDNHVVQPTAADQPLFETDISRGFPALNFDGSNDYMYRGALTLTESPMTIVMISNQDHTVTGTGGYVNFSDASANNQLISLQEFANNGLRSITYSGGSFIGSPYQSLTANLNVSIGVFTASTQKTFLNGTAGTLTSSVTPTNIDIFTIGKFERSSSDIFQAGRYTRVVVFSEALSDSTVSSMMTVINNYYDLS